MLCNFYENFDFQAQWISLSGADKIHNCALEYYCQFFFKNGQETLLRIAAENYYVLFVNGIFVGRGPVRGTFAVNYFDTYDVRQLLREGENHIAVMVQSMNVIGNFNSYPAGCALLAEMPGSFKTDTSWKVRQMPGWLNSEEFFSMQHGFRVEMDLRKTAGENWRLGEGTANWAKASIFASEALSRKALRPRGIPELTPAMESPQLLKAGRITLEPASDDHDFRKRADTGDMHPITPKQEGDDAWSVPLPSETEEITALIYDFGSPRIGYFDFTVTGDNLDGVRLDVIYGEELWNGRLRTVYPLSIYSFTDTYYLRDGENHIEHPFEMHGASMLQLNFSRTSPGVASAVRISNVCCAECRYPYKPDTQFHCSDPVLEHIWEMCRETMAACTTDVFLDCPWREHAFWINDLLVENRSSLMLFGPADVHRHAFDVLFSQQFPNGWISGVAPDTCTAEKPQNLMCPTMLFLFTVMEDYLMESADTATVKRYLPNLKKVLDAFEATADETGLIKSLRQDSSFYDWGFEQNHITFHNARESMLNSLYIGALKCYLRLCEYTCTACAEAAELKQRIARVSCALRSFLATDEATGRKTIMDNAFLISQDGKTRTPITMQSELSQALAVLSGALSPEENADLLKNLADGKLHRSELYLQGIVFQALAANGYAEEALRRLRKYWSTAIAHGAKTIPESAIYGYGREMFWESGSLCHGFSTCPTDFFRNVILGIRPLKPGFEEFTVNPLPCGLSYASGKVYTPFGTIIVRWEMKDGDIKTSVQCPLGTKWVK